MTPGARRALMRRDVWVALLSAVLLWNAVVTQNNVDEIQQQQDDLQQSRRDGARRSCALTNNERTVDRSQLRRQLAQIKRLPHETFLLFETTKEEAVENVAKDLALVQPLDCDEFVEQLKLQD